MIASESFQRFASRFWLTRPFVRRDGAVIFDLMSGFVKTQVLLAAHRLGILSRLTEGPASLHELAHQTGLNLDRCAALARAAEAIGLLRRTRGGDYRLTSHAMAITSVPGLTDLIEHHAMFYRDMADPVGILTGERGTELSHFWPYVLGGGTPEATGTYSRLMAITQAMVIEDTLAQNDLSHWESLLDLGGGTGRFARAVAQKHPDLRLGVLDLPDVTALSGIGSGVAHHGQSFLDPLPQGYRSMSLIRVLYDHEDTTVRMLLRNIFEALPPGGQLLISEPMSGGARPDKTTDVYFAFYTMAMTTGTVRSAQQIADLLEGAGFEGIRIRRPYRPYVTQSLTATRP